MSNVKPIINKIPGEIIPLPKKSSQGYIDDLTGKEKFELLDLLARQEKLLNNKKFISKLPDKGEKILNLKEKIEVELKRRDEIEGAAKLLSRLNIATEGKAAMSELEWTGKYKEKSQKDHETIVELDDDEEDPLKILAQPTGSGVHKKKIIHIEPEESLIKPNDIVEAESFKTMNPLELEHVKYIVNKIDNLENTNKDKFMPYKTTKSNVHDPEKEKQREAKKNKHWEITAATPPLIVHGAAKTIDLNESLKLQKEHAIRLQELQTKHAAERLAQQLGIHKVGDLPKTVGSYRTQGNSDDSNSDDEQEYQEVYDDEDHDHNDKRGTVVFTVDTEES